MRIVILGLSSSTFILIHVLLSLSGIGTGFVVLVGFLKGKRLKGWTAIYFTASLLTTATGFLFPLDVVLPTHMLGLLSALALTIAIVAYNAFGFNGWSRAVYVVTLASALYFNCFAAVLQAFAKIAALNAVAPTRTEWPYVMAQSVVLALFVVLTYLAAKRFAVAKFRDI
jgi:hypothetical protein